MKKSIKICNSCGKPKMEGYCKCVKVKSHNIDQSNYKLYSSYKWRKFAHKLRDERILCELCLQEGRTTECQMLDHITPINRGGSVWSLSNLMVLCNHCHAVKSAKDRWGKNKK